jgi:DEAD/DEAH box helicase domain-containing protein
MRAQNIHALYSHQATTWEQVRAGQHPAIVTGTASGKSLCYNLPVLDRLLRDPEARALYLFPTKALAHDQAASLQHLIALCENQPGDNHEKHLHPWRCTPGGRRAVCPQAQVSKIVPTTYDGDTPTASRVAIRQQARLLITNPDMVHAGILPHHTLWADFFRALQFVVIDEMHLYRGVFGSHVANVLRRLKRVARFYGASPQFILTSATIANPVELAERLIEAPVALVDQDGSPTGTRHFLVYNPPIVNQALGLRRSALAETVRLGQDLIHHQIQTIIFARSRRVVEILLNNLRAAPPGGETPRAEGQTIRGYRSGYLPRHRREIEQGLREGGVRAVVATTALELGIDVGGMGAALLAGYPGTIAGTWQQAGRAGRTEQDSLAVLITSANPLDQFLAHHPEYFFDRSPERALINPDNLLVLWQHLRCAAFELPFEVDGAFGRVKADLLREMLHLLQQAGDLHLTGYKYFWMADQYPAEQVSLRGASPENVLLQVEEEGAVSTIGQVDLVSAPWLVHPQAVYLHEGQSYLVESLELNQKLARLRLIDLDYYTEPRRESTVELLDKFDEVEAGGAGKACGEITITTQVTGFHRIRWFTQERLGQGELSLPPTELQTTGYWLTLAEATVAQLRAEGLWRNDPNDYGPNWSSQRDQARVRDQYRCQICGAPEQGRSHDVHHKIPFRTFASYRQANQLANLVTLCRPCHRRAELAVRVRSGLAGLAYVLGHLAPLFLMCDRNDIGLHTEPKSAWAGGRPAVLIYDLAPGGIGFSRRLFELHDEVVTRAYALVASCDCADGCPACIGPAGEDGAGGKDQTLAILQALVG